MFKLRIISNQKSAKEEIKEMLKKARKKAKEVIRKAEGKATKLAKKNKVKNLKKRIQIQEKELKSQKEENQNLRNQLQTLSQISTQKDSKIADLENQLQREKKEFNKRLEEFQEVTNGERKLLGKLSQEISFLKNTLADRNQELERRDQEIKNLMMAMDTQLKMNEKLETLLKTQKEKNQELERSLREMESFFQERLEKVLNHILQEREFLIEISNTLRHTSWSSKYDRIIFSFADKVEKQIEEEKKMERKIRRWRGKLNRA